jgi:branched-chain amino acid transport system ATP-binding protein
VLTAPETPRQRLALLLSGAGGGSTEATTHVEVIHERNGSAPHPTAQNAHEDTEEVVVKTGSRSRLAELMNSTESRVVSLPIHREDRAVLLGAENITMRFGGLTAVDDVSMSVREGEIVGLIGPNGAGKTTTFNCISGLLVPTTGKVTLFGKDVTSMPVHERAKMGLGRTFQVIQLFPQLTVFDNLLVATHSSNRTGVLSHLAVTRHAIIAEREARKWVGQVVELLDLAVSGLPFGVLRMVEVARAIVTGARLVMLDEPASGLDNTETQRLSDLLLTLRVALGLTLLLIEHDVKMVTSVSDYMYVLDRGRLLAEGTPRDVQRNRDVIAAYLGEPAKEGVA